MSSVIDARLKGKLGASFLFSVWFETVRTDSGLFGLHGYWREGPSSSYLRRVDGFLLGSDVRQFLRLRILYRIDHKVGSW